MAKKWAIDYSLGVRECGSCNNILPLSNFSTKGAKQVSHSVCKPCNARRATNAKQERKSKMSPESYWSCPDCDSIYHILTRQCRCCGYKGEIVSIKDDY